MNGGFNAALAKWRTERNAAFRTLDLEYFRAQAPSCSPEVLLMSVHKARYECPDIEAPLRHASGRWLRSNGHGRMNGMDLLPEGQLPV